MSSNHKDRDIKGQLICECMAMLDFATDAGQRISPHALSQLQTIAENSQNPRTVASLATDAQEVNILTGIHNQLVDLVTPAIPRTIMLQYNSSKKGLLRFSGRIPMVHQMRNFALVSLIGLVLCSLLPGVNVNAESFDLVSKSQVGFSPLQALTRSFNILFILSAASMGACFAGLYTANLYIKRSTFDNIYVSSYWTRYILGLMSGIMIAMLIPIESLLLELSGASVKTAPEQAVSQQAQPAPSPSAPLTPTQIEPGTNPLQDPSAQASNNTETATLGPPIDPDKVPSGMSRPLLALLGGFAASFVYRVLDKIVKMLEAGVKSDPKETVATRVGAARIRMESNISSERLNQVRDLNLLQQRLADGASADEVKEALSIMKENLIQSDTLAG